MAARTLSGTQATRSNSNRFRSLPILDSLPFSSLCPSAVLRICSFTGRGVVLHPLKGWTCGSSLEVRRLPAKGCSRKKCGVTVVALGQQQASRDRVVDFGKFKGTMMGTLPSKYLTWMVNNLTSGPWSEWSDYAGEVLVDPHYRDRLEWENVEKLMTKAHDVGSVTGNRHTVLAPAKMYGWDLEDDDGWRKVNFSLIGTSEGGLIPRVKGGVLHPVPEKKKPAPRKKNSIRRTAITTISGVSSTPSPVEDSSSSGSLRDELMRRRGQRRDRLMAARGLLSGNAEAAEAHQALCNKFPGRESLLITVRSNDISE